MNDYKRMKGCLESLSESQFLELYGKVYPELQVTEVEGDGCFELGPEGSRKLGKNWRQRYIDALLNAREEDKALWNKLCDAAGIPTDASEQMILARRASRRAWIGILLALSGLAWHVAREIIPYDYLRYGSSTTTAAP